MCVVDMETATAVRCARWKKIFPGTALLAAVTVSILAVEAQSLLEGDRRYMPLNEVRNPASPVAALAHLASLAASPRARQGQLSKIKKMTKQVEKRRKQMLAAVCAAAIAVIAVFYSLKRRVAPEEVSQLKALNQPPVWFESEDEDDEEDAYLSQELAYVLRGEWRRDALAFRTMVRES